MRSIVESDIVLTARTDALQSLGYDATVSCLKRTVKLGADVVFLKCMTSLDQCQRVCSDLAPTPILLMVPGGATPDMSVDKANEMGFGS